MAETIKISGEFEDKISKSLDKVIGRVEDLQSAAEKGFSKSNLAFSSFVGNLAAAGAEKALSAITSAANELFQTFVVEGVAAASEAQDSLNNLNQALAASGNFSREASEDFQAFARSIEETTKFSDDAVIAAGALIERLTQLDVQGLKKATEAAVNLSAVMGTDLQTAALNVAKAAEGQTGALQKLGLTIVKGNSEAETFANTLDAINAKFAGAAVAQVQTFSGAVAQVGNQFNNLQEAIGSSIVENVAVIETLKAVALEFIGTAKGAGEAGLSLRVFVAQGILIAIDALALLVVAVDSVVSAFQIGFNLVKIIVVGLEGVIVGLVDIVLQVVQTIGNAFGGLGSVFDGVASSVSSLSSAISDDLQEAFSSITEAGTQSSGAADALTASLARIRGAAQDGFNAVSQGAIATNEPVNQAGARVDGLTQRLKELGEEGKKIAERFLAQANPEDQAAKEQEALQAAFDQKLITEQEYQIARQESIDQATIKEADALLAKNEQLRQINDQKSIEELTANQKKLDALVAQEDISAKASLAIRAKKEKAEKELDRQRLQATADIFGNIATISKAAGKEAFAVTKAASAAQAVVLGILAVQQALASAPFPFNIVLAATVGAVAALNVANILSSQPPAYAKGVDSVPGFGTKDSVPALLTPGERVVPRKSNEDLTAFLSQSAGMTAFLASIDQKIETISQNVVVNVGGRELVNVLRDEVLSGRELAVNV